MERLVISIDGDSTGLTKALGSAETRLENFNSRISNSSRNLTNLQKKMTLLAASMNTLGAANSRAITGLATFTSRLHAASSAATTSSRSMNRASASARNLGGSLAGVRNTISSIHAVMLGTGFLFGGLIKSTIEANSRMERMNILLKNISTASTEAGKALDAQKNMDALWKMADNAPFKIDAISNAFVKFKANGIDPTNGSLQTVIDSVAAFGGDTENLKSATLAISQMMSKGVVSMQELRQQLGDSGGIADALRAMAKGLGFEENTEGLRKFYKEVEKGNVMSAKAVGAMLTELQKRHKGAAAEMMNTWDGVTARLTNSWQKFLYRTTRASGGNSFFNTVKKQIEELTKFLNSNEGDAFAKKFSEGMATIVKGLADAIKWVYKYREELAFVGKAMLVLWSLGKVKNIFTGLIEGAIGYWGAGKKVITTTVSMVDWLKKLYNVKNGVSLVTLVFGRSVTKSAMAMGLFNAQSKISIVQLGLMLLRFGAVGIAVGALAAGLYLLHRRHEASQAPAKQFVKSLDETKTFSEHAQDAIDKLATATGKAGAEALKAARNFQMLGKVRIGELWNTTMSGRLEQDKALAELRAYKAASPQEKQEYHRQGKNESTLTSALKKKTAELNLTTEALKTATTTQEKTNAAIKDYLNPNKGIVVGDPNDDFQTEDKEDKKFKNKLETRRNRWVNLKVKSDELQYELLHGNTEDFDAEKAQDDAQAWADANLKGLEQAEDAITRTTQLNKKLREDIAHKSVITELTTDIEKNRKEVGGLVRDYERGFETMESAVDKFNQALQDQYSEQLKNSSPEKIAEIQARMAEASEVYTQKVIIERAQEIEEKNREIVESLMSEDEVREDNYRREVERIQDLLSKITGKTQGELLAAQRINEYLKNLEKRHKIDKMGPLGQWAMDAKNLGTNIKDSLGNSLTGFFDQLAQGKLNFKDFAKSILKDIAAIIIRALIAQAILSAIGLGGGGFSAPTGASPGMSLQYTHTGGVAGSNEGSNKTISGNMFNFAKKYHSGGFPGLENDEVPIIARKGEGVFTQEQMKALGMGAASPAPASPTVNIINQTGTPVSSEQTNARFDGEKYVIDILLKNANRPGPVREMLKGINK